jgi:hypothetical protein
LETTVDGIRKHEWNNERVEWWYAQNMLFFVRESHFSKYPRLKKGRQSTCAGQLSLVHPENYRRAHWQTRLRKFQHAVEHYISEGDHIVLVDDNEFSAAFDVSCSVTRFFGGATEDQGPPADSNAAIEKLQVRRAQPRF